MSPVEQSGFVCVVHPYRVLTVRCSSHSAEARTTSHVFFELFHVSLSLCSCTQMSWVPGALCWVCSAKQDLLCSQGACCRPHRSAGKLAAVVLWPQRSILYGRTKSNVTQCNIFLCDFFQLPLQQLKTSLHELSLEAPPFFWLSLV